MSRIIPYVLAAAVFIAFASPVSLSALEKEAGKTSSGPGETVMHWKTGKGKSYLIPAIEIPSSLIALNLYDRAAFGNETYGVTPGTFWDHVRHENWVYDTDSFRMNQFGHPYMGSFMYGFARSSGLSVWESWIYSNAGSLLWEWGGETGPPSTNDIITTGQAGSIIGEALFRMSNVILSGGGGEPPFWRKLGAAVVSPPTAINRLLFGDRFTPIYPAHDPAKFTTLKFIGNLQKASVGDGVSKTPKSKQLGLDFTMAYGLPGKDAYKYTHPFDYFNFNCTTLFDTGILENLMVRGLLLGDKYESGENYRGIWGLYAVYDYISPTIFRVSNTSVALGTTGQWWLSRNTALQGTILGGPGYGGGAVVPTQGQRNYHMGGSLQGLTALRLIVDKRFMLNANLRAYDISGIRSPDSGTSEMIARGDASLTVHLFGPHSVGLQYVQSRRYSRFPTIGGSFQKVDMTSLAYTLAFEPHFGAVEWRDGMDSGNQ